MRSGSHIPVGRGTWANKTQPEKSLACLCIFRTYINMRIVCPPVEFIICLCIGEIQIPIGCFVGLQSD
jgi:hypothetical protein